MTNTNTDTAHHHHHHHHNHHRENSNAEVEEERELMKLVELNERFELAKERKMFKEAKELAREHLVMFEARSRRNECEKKMMAPMIKAMEEDLNEINIALEKQEQRGRRRQQQEREKGEEEEEEEEKNKSEINTTKTLRTVDENAFEMRTNTCGPITTTTTTTTTTTKMKASAPPMTPSSVDAVIGNDAATIKIKEKEEAPKLVSPSSRKKLKTNAMAWGIAVDEDDEDDQFRMEDNNDNNKKEEVEADKVLKSYGALKKEKKEEKKMTKMEELQEEARRVQLEQRQNAIPVERVVNYGKPTSLHEENNDNNNNIYNNARAVGGGRSRQSPRKQQQRNSSNNNNNNNNSNNRNNNNNNKRASAASRYHVNDDDDGTTYGNNNSRKRRYNNNKRISADAGANDDDDDDVVICEDDAAKSKPARAMQFMTAGTHYDFERAQKGLAPVIQPYREAKENGLITNGTVGNGNKVLVPGQTGFRGPFDPKPVVNNQQQKNKDDPNGDSSPPFSELALRRLQPTGTETIPDELLKLEREIVERVIGEVLDKPSTVSWDSIVGLEHAKNAVQELAVWPMTNPELFTGARAVPKGLLLFGPPGTGKTMIGKAVASQCNATFFSISASSLTSKWIGDGEKMVRALFAVARHCAPSVIFVDEIDSLLSARKSEGEHESSRRMKTEFLVQMDGLGSEDKTKPMLLIGATNRPQELDDGARRRLAKQLYIPLPCAAARRDMILKTLSPAGETAVIHALTEKDLDIICEKTEGYSGSDLKNLVQEAARAPLRELFAKKKSERKLNGGGEGDNDSNVGIIVDLTKNSQQDEAKELREISVDDIRKAAKQVRASVTRADVEFHEEWNRKHGALSTDLLEDDGEW